MKGTGKRKLTPSERLDLLKKLVREDRTLLERLKDR